MESSLKENLKSTFWNAKESYEDNTPIQSCLQDKLLELLEKHSIQKVSSLLELGSGRGIFSKKLQNALEIESFIALDLVDFSKDFQNLKIEFICDDIENKILIKNIYQTKQIQMLVSNATLQWISQKSFFENLSFIAPKDSYLCFSVFSKGNLREIKELCGAGLEYLSKQDYENILHKDWKILEIIPLSFQLSFSSPILAFKHLKLSGVNSLHSNFYLGKKHLLGLEKTFENTLSYEALCILAQKR
ncbi:biotin biosynthesis protein BioC [Helicobacter burdigaliensis]|uniref:biotin biosynthesis protein BioC n=1 Tax=Helicobacter burdigaliensis TaxID=2315334 RepID=UPI000EF66DF9|nr:biotin biosynthesis protein BioC [Helicobacter burdigaliensis]